MKILTNQLLYLKELQRQRQIARKRFFSCDARIILLETISSELKENIGDEKLPEEILSELLKIDYDYDIKKILLSYKNLISFIIKKNDL